MNVFLCFVSFVVFVSLVVPFLDAVNGYQGAYAPRSPLLT